MNLFPVKVFLKLFERFYKTGRFALNELISSSTCFSRGECPVAVVTAAVVEVADFEGDATFEAGSVFELETFLD